MCFMGNSLIHHHHHHHHRPHCTTRLTWCKYSSASAARNKVSVMHVVMSESPRKRIAYVFNVIEFEGLKQTLHFLLLT